MPGCKVLQSLGLRRQRFLLNTNHFFKKAGSERRDEKVVELRKTFCIGMIFAYL